MPAEEKRKFFFHDRTQIVEDKAYAKVQDEINEKQPRVIQMSRIEVLRSGREHMLNEMRRHSDQTDNFY